MAFSHLPFFHVFLRSTLLFVLITMSNAEGNKVSAVFVFGDSTSDPGNNNFILTLFKGNFPPYGRDFDNQIPTGRFSNGLLTSDYIARYLGVKDSVPPYLDPTLTIQDLITGVSFASAGSGYDPLTPRISNVISLPRQLEYFQEYKIKMAASIGIVRTEEIVHNALYLVGAGTNDFVLNYFTLPIRRKTFSLPKYVDFLLGTQLDFLQNLWDQGARRIGVAGLPPMGCLPIVITFYSDNAIYDRGCIDYFSAIARSYNVMLQSRLYLKQHDYISEGGRIAYFDTYGPLSDGIIGHKYGFEEVSVGCCGTGLYEATILCNSKTSVCPNASKYVFWDSIHPTQEMYKIVFETVQSTIDRMIDG